MFIIESQHCNILEMCASADIYVLKNPKFRAAIFFFYFSLALLFVNVAKYYLGMKGLLEHNGETYFAHSHCLAYAAHFSLSSHSLQYTIPVALALTVTVL